MVIHDKARRRGSAGPAPTSTRSGSSRHLNMDKASRRRSTGPGGEGGEETTGAEPFDPFSTDVTEALEQAAKADSKKVRRPPTRSASVGTLPVSASNFAAVDNNDDDLFDDDDMMFDEVDWDNVATAESSQKKKEKSSGKSRRQSLTNKSKAEDSDDYDSKDEGDEEKKERRKKKSSTKSRRQSLDSAITNAEADDDDGFGPIKTYGFSEEAGTSASASENRRKGMSRSKSASGDNLEVGSNHSSGKEPAPKRIIHRRRSETHRVPRRKSSVAKNADGSQGTEDTAESLDASEE